MPELNRDGVTIHYEVHGDGPPVLLTHGYSASCRMWDPQVEALSRDHILITWDIRGHGRSDSPYDDDAYGEAQTVDDMLALLDHLGLEQAVIGGLSLGGYMSLAFHLRHPGRVRALLIIDCGPGYKSDQAREGWNQYALERAAEIERDGEAALAGSSVEQAQSQHDDVMGLVYAGRNMLTQHGPHVIESLPDIGVPSLVVVGSEDEPFIAASEYMARKIPDAQYALIDAAGHAANMDQPDAFNRVVVDFLSRLP